MVMFMDMYSSYNQIRMHILNQEHTSFSTDQGLYCYRVMPFDLKNAKATYQRTVKKMIAKQIGWDMEVYVDVMLVKSKKFDQHEVNLDESFNIQKMYNMNLNPNPSKCTFNVMSGNFNEK